MQIKHPLDNPETRALIGAKLAISQQAINNWKHRTVPVKHCMVIERLTKGAVTRKDLRPTDYWLHWPDLKKPRAAKAVA